MKAGSARPLKPSAQTASQSHSQIESTIRLRGFLLRSLERTDGVYDVSVPEARVLVALVALEEILGLTTITQARLARILSITEPSLNKPINELRRLRLIVGSDSELTDNKRKPFRITSEGRVALEQFQDRYLAFPAEALEETRRQDGYDKILRTTLDGVQKPLEKRLRVLSSDNYHDAMTFLERKIESNWKDVVADTKKDMQETIYQAFVRAADEDRLDSRPALEKVQQTLIGRWPQLRDRKH